MKENTRDRICAAVLKMIEAPSGAGGVTMRKVADAVGVTPMAIYKHFANREDLLQAATLLEYGRIAEYFEKANARKSNKGLHGMLGYLEYALDHPHLFKYVFSSPRNDAYVYPDPNTEKSPTFKILITQIQAAMDAGKLQSDNALEVSLDVWAFAHGLVSLYLAGRIRLSHNAFRELYLRSLDRLLYGLRRVA